MSLDYSTEVMRQHAAHKEVRARLYAKPVVKAVVQSVSLSTVPVAAVDNLPTDENRIRDWFAQCHEADAVEELSSEAAIGAIFLEVRKQFGLSRVDFLSARRTQNLVVPRQIAMALSKHLTLRSLPEIGRRMGGRDHTTILHGCRKLQPVTDAVAVRLEQGASIREWVAAMKEQVTITPFAKCPRYDKKGRR